MAKACFTLTQSFRFLCCSFFALLALMAPNSTQAAGFEELHRFSSRSGLSNRLVRGPSGDYFGVSFGGGPGGKGVLFRISAATDTYQVLAYFGGPLLREPNTYIVVDASNNVFGIANNDLGPTDKQVVWRWNSTSGLIPIGAIDDPRAGTIVGLALDAQGGLIFSSYPSQIGALWRWHASTGTSLLSPYSPATTGPRTLNSVVVDSDGNYYACSEEENGTQTLWRWKTTEGAFEKLADLPTDTFGKKSTELTIDSIGRVWGVMTQDGPRNNGTLWRWSPAGGVEKLADFSPGGGSDNVTTKGPVAFGPDGTPFIFSGGFYSGRILKWTADTGLTNHADIPPIQAGHPSGYLIVDEGGAFYGGGTAPWKWSEADEAVNLQSSPEHSNAGGQSGLVRDSQGRLYATTYGLPSVLWRWSDGGGYEVLATFDKDTRPYSPSIGPDGNIYGIVSGGEINPDGTLWRWNEQSGLNKIANFNPSETGYPAIALAFGNNGAVYGTSFDSTIQHGWIWKWTAEGGITKVFTLENGFGSFSPNPVVGPNGRWYGTLTSGGTAAGGSLWSWSESNGFVTHFNFGNGTATNPDIRLARDAAGNIYGTCGAFSSTKTLWRWSPTSYAELGTFEKSTTGEGVVCINADAEGVLYGTCQFGGASGAGTIWTWKNGSGLSAIHHFDARVSWGSDATSLVKDNGGDLRGVANGLLWRYTFPSAVSAPSVITGSPILNGTSLAIPGSANANDADASISLQLGLAADALTETIAASPSAVTGDAFTAVSAPLQGLRQHTLYFARFTATNSQGTTVGNLVPFMTPNDLPVVVNDVVHSPSIASAPFVFDVLANDHDGEDSLIITTAYGAQYGTVEVVDNKLRYTPGPTFGGADNVSYYVSDGRSMVSATLAIENQPIQVMDDIVQYSEGPLVFDPLSSDQDLDGDPLTITGVTQPYHGIVEVANNEISYTRNAGHFGTDYLTYTVSDGRGQSATAKIEVRPALLHSQAVLSVGATLTSPAGDLLVTRIGSISSLGEGLIVAETRNDAKRRGQAVISAIDGAVLIAPGTPLPGLSGATVRSIRGTSGRAVLVTYGMEKSSRARAAQAIVYVNSAGELQLVAHEGGLLPDEASLTAINGFSEAGGHVFVFAKCRTTAGKSAQSLQVWRVGQSNELVRSGSTVIDERIVKSITTLVPAPGSPATNRWTDADGRIVTRVILADGDEAVVIFKAGELAQIVAKHGDESVGVGEYLRFGLPSLCPDGAAYRASQLEFPNRLFWSVYGEVPDLGLEQIAREKSNATPEPGTVITRLMDPVASDPGKFAFLADVAGPGKALRSLFWFNGLELKLVARQGDPLPAGKGRFGTIKSIALPPGSSRGPVFTMPTAKGLSLWAADETGAPSLLVAPGTSLTLAGEQRTVKSLRALEGSRVGGQDSSDFDLFGHVSAVIKFTDGSESLVHLALP